MLRRAIVVMRVARHPNRPPQSRSAVTGRESMGFGVVEGAGHR